MFRLGLLAVVGCTGAAHPVQPDPSAPLAIDRFSPQAGHLQVRGGKKPFPAPGAPIDFDKPPFITQAFGPDGGVVRYYNFDVQRDVPATLYRPTRGGQPIAGQLDIVDVLPGDATYSDFFRIARVEIPVGVAPHSYADLATYPVTLDDTIVDCPVVPPGSTAREGDGVAPAIPTKLWYRATQIDCLGFGQLSGQLSGSTKVPTSPIYVTFGSEGFKTVGATPQTHNVVFSVPGDTDYSPLWDVHVYDERAFDLVRDEATALKARVVAPGPLVNCPVVTVKRAPR